MQPDVPTNIMEHQHCLKPFQVSCCLQSYFWVTQVRGHLLAWQAC